MKRMAALLFMSCLLSVAGVARAGMYGSFDGYATLTLASSGTSVKSTASILYDPYEDCPVFNGREACAYWIGGSQEIRPGFRMPFASDSVSYRGTLEAPASPNTCYMGSAEATSFVQPQDYFYPVPLDSSSWDSEEVCVLLPPRTIYRLIEYADMGSGPQFVAMRDLESGTVVTLTAKTPADYVFIGWSGDLTSSQNPVMFQIFSNMSVTANFLYVPPPPPGEPLPCDNCSPDNPNPPNSPVVLNLGRGGYALTGSDSPVLFDIAASGAPAPIGWTAAGADEAFLCLDRNGNGTIDDGGELFGTATRLRSSLRAPNGFVALGEYDDNHDGVIDARDAVWAQLLLWRDLNHDGISQPLELAPVAASQVRAIGLGHHWAGRRDRWGNTFRYEAVAWIDDGARSAPQPVYDIFFVSVP